MSDGRNVTIGRDGQGNAIATGDNNLTVVLLGLTEFWTSCWPRCAAAG